MSESAFEVFKEKMKAAAAQIAAIKKEEGKQKKKEEELHRVLLKFIQRSDKKDLCLLISRALEQNIPANFILAIILLGNEDIQKEVGKFIMLPEGHSGTDVVPGDESSSEAVSSQDSLSGASPSASPEEPPRALTFFDAEDQTLPIKIKAEVDSWIKNMLYQAQESPQKLVKTAYDKEMVKIAEGSSFEEAQYEEREKIKEILPRLVAFVLRDFLEQNKIDEKYEKLTNFASFIIKGILTKVREELDKRKFIGGEVSDIS